jgi:outer membrane immunogenic protein
MLARNWILRGEYRYSDYGSSQYTFFGESSRMSLDQFAFTVDQQTHTAYVGLSYLLLPAAVAGRPDFGRMPTKAPAMRPGPGYDWTGFYIGPHIGGVWADTDWIDVTGLLAPPNIPGFAIPLDPHGFLAGGQVGFNYQTGSWVLGIEAQGSWTNATGRNSPLTAPPPAAIDTHLDSDINWLVTVTGRIGHSINGSLLYLKGGLALADERHSAEITALGGVPVPVKGSNGTRSGWVVGAGAEWVIAGNWSTRLEYNFMDFGTERFRITPSGTAPTPFDVDQQLHSLTVGVNYRFGQALAH